MCFTLWCYTLHFPPFIRQSKCHLSIIFHFFGRFLAPIVGSFHWLHVTFSIDFKSLAKNSKTVLILQPCKCCKIHIYLEEHAIILFNGSTETGIKGLKICIAHPRLNSTNQSDERTVRLSTNQQCLLGTCRCLQRRGRGKT